jgi:hypothetical protein
MGLHQQALPIQLKPTTSVALSQLDEIHRPVVFVGPVVVFNVANGDIHENDTPGAQQRHHAPV